MWRVFYRLPQWGQHEFNVLTLRTLHYLKWKHEVGPLCERWYSRFLGKSRKWEKKQ